MSSTRKPGAWLELSSSPDGLPTPEGDLLAILPHASDMVGLARTLRELRTASAFVARTAGAESLAKALEREVSDLQEIERELAQQWRDITARYPDMFHPLDLDKETVAAAAAVAMGLMPPHTEGYLVRKLYIGFTLIMLYLIVNGAADVIEAWVKLKLRLESQEIGWESSLPGHRQPPVPDITRADI